MMTYWVHDDEAAVLITISAVDSGDGCYVRLCQSRDTLLVRAPDSWLKGCEFKSQQEQQENFLLQRFYADSYSASIATPMLSQ